MFFIILLSTRVSKAKLEVQTTVWNFYSSVKLLLFLSYYLMVLADLQMSSWNCHIRYLPRSQQVLRTLHIEMTWTVWPKYRLHSFSSLWPVYLKRWKLQKLKKLTKKLSDLVFRCLLLMLNVWLFCKTNTWNKGRVFCAWRCGVLAQVWILGVKKEEEKMQNFHWKIDLSHIL